MSELYFNPAEVEKGPPREVVEAAVHTASLGSCAKSQRGVVIFERRASNFFADRHKGFVIYGNAHNSPPWPFECSKTDACKKDCGRICVHAEQRAIMQMLMSDMEELPARADMELVHVKVVDGKLVTSKRPSCDQCSKLMLEASHIKAVWLYVDPGVWTVSSTMDFHAATLKNLGLHVHL